MSTRTARGCGRRRGCRVNCGFSRSRSLTYQKAAAKIKYMRIPSVYLETTIFNFPFADDAPQYQADTLKLFDEIKAGKFVPFTSKYVLDELAKTKEPGRRARMEALVIEHEMEVLPARDEIKRLAGMYIEQGIIPKGYSDDALHLAAAAFYGMDYIVSLNFRHIVRHKTMLETEIVNLREGYKRVFIHSPAEVIENDENI